MYAAETMPRNNYERTTALDAPEKMSLHVEGRNQKKQMFLKTFTNHCFATQQIHLCKDFFLGGYCEIRILN